MEIKRKEEKGRKRDQREEEGEEEREEERKVCELKSSSIRETNAFSLILTKIAENSKIRGYAAKRKKRAAKLKLLTDNPDDNKDTKNTVIFVVVPEEKGYDIPTTKPQKRSSGNQRVFP
ncbi:hypothetical protein ADUPG1_008956 [Aduncisulcus paluster]|uniref:Uncharacterized protein n=1 Tax=Aduncisulcus paluster TaxID=2918883 RepID=A0ABQ5KTV9_9EUKA|nr:hypothetical protein ADUPG1_008956 [Aduncisulcus paluster]